MPPSPIAPQLIAPQLIALDLDGTLLNPEGRVSPRNLATLLAAERAGITVVLATGRRHFYALKVLHDLGLNPDTVLISSNGAIVRTLASKLLERTEMTSASARWLAHHLGDFRDALVVTFDRTHPTTGEDMRGALVVESLNFLNTSIGQWMQANEPYIEIVSPIERCLTDPANPPIQMMLAGPIDRMRRAEAHLLLSPEVAAVGEPGLTDGGTAATIQLARTEYPARDLSLVDILPAGCSKGAAILRLAAQRDIPRSEITCIGDNWNDLSMLEIAGHPILMGNAPEALQALAAQRGWRLTATHAEDGVADAIEHLHPHLLPTPV